RPPDASCGQSSRPRAHHIPERMVQYWRGWPPHLPPPAPSGCLNSHHPTLGPGEKLLLLKAPPPYTCLNSTPNECLVGGDMLKQGERHLIALKCCSDICFEDVGAGWWWEVHAGRGMAL
ncbi:hypothetical protein KUCAC02_016217, partial [Chaenocephalus aceratus]